MTPGIEKSENGSASGKARCRSLNSVSASNLSVCLNCCISSRHQGQGWPPPSRTPSPHSPGTQGKRNPASVNPLKSLPLACLGHMLTPGPITGSWNNRILQLASLGPTRLTVPPELWKEEEKISQNERCEAEKTEREEEETKISWTPTPCQAQ